MTTKTRHLTVEELAERWRCSVYTVRRRVNTGELEGFREGRRWLFKDRAVTEYEKAHSNVGVVRGRAS